ncbi:hypothetical protein HDF18_06355 [Mucilaginibacter sp. X5P1]|uniref:hypothetical protein n=1 Tax=Mucilaginibacter sp. X5P1 TaxID=2723088 RepID=UPI001618D884|nr:hypothetical protein [Mucilaginibacter sp. X5P1]MBB6137258.1 hypothetical protein [Mucilaginibacter sp. X5P1]
MFKKLIATLIIISTFIYAHAQTTKVVIRAKAKDAKFIGTPIGGALVIVKNNLTGEILAKGLTTGGSGSTDVLIKKPIVRGQSLTDSATAKFVAEVNITEPTFADIEVIAPVNRRNGTVKASTQIWLIPGKNILGDGIVLEIPGFILDVLSPTTHQFIKLDSLKNGELKFKASLTLECGCPITNGGIWNSDDIAVNAIVKKEGVKTGELSLQFIEQNLFEGTLKVKEKGDYELDVYAYDAKTGNTGVDRINFVIQ